MTLPRDFVQPLPPETLKTLTEFIEYSDAVDVADSSRPFPEEVQGFRQQCISRHAVEVQRSFVRQMVRLVSK